MELDAAKLGAVRQVHEVDAGDRGAGLVLARAARNVPAPAADVEHDGRRAERRRSGDTMRSFARSSDPIAARNSGASSPQRACG